MLKLGAGSADPEVSCSLQVENLFKMSYYERERENWRSVCVCSPLEVRKPTEPGCSASEPFDPNRLEPFCMILVVCPKETKCKSKQIGL